MVCGQRVLMWGCSLHSADWSVIGLASLVQNWASKLRTPKMSWVFCCVWGQKKVLPLPSLPKCNTPQSGIVLGELWTFWPIFSFFSPLQLSRCIFIFLLLWPCSTVADHCECTADISSYKIAGWNPLWTSHFLKLSIKVSSVLFWASSEHLLS